jgi:hypothetical protein
MRSHFDNIPQLVDDIDTRNARFSGVALRKIRYFLRQDRRTEGQLQFIVDALAKNEAPELEFDVFRCELLAGNFLYTPPVARERARPQRLVPRSTANRERIRQEAVARVRRLFARRRIEEFVATVLHGRASAPMREVPVRDDDDYIRLLYLASYGLDATRRFDSGPLAGVCTLRHTDTPTEHWRRCGRTEATSGENPWISLRTIRGLNQASRNVFSVS